MAATRRPALPEQDQQMLKEGHALIETKQITVREFAEMTGINESSLSKYLRGKVIPSEDRVALIREAVAKFNADHAPTKEEKPKKKRPVATVNKELEEAVFGKAEDKTKSKKKPAAAAPLPEEKINKAVQEEIGIYMRRAKERADEIEKKLAEAERRINKMANDIAILEVDTKVFDKGAREYTNEQIDAIRDKLRTSTLGQRIKGTWLE